MKIQEQILKALKEEITHKIECYDCLIASFYLTSIGEKIYPKFNGRVPCFYRFCAILKYYFGIDPKEVIKIYEKHGRANELIFCKRYKFKKELQQEVYNLCLKYNNFNKI